MNIKTDSDKTNSVVYPLISVITVVYNAIGTLEDTIKSVINQNNTLFEYIIIDGGSTDGSIDLIHKYEERLAYWKSETDNGIYDAMNKGIDQAKGKWLYFLGGDDTLEVNILDYLVPYLDENYSIVYGDVMFDNGHIMKSFLGPRTIFQNTIHHQSVFYHRSIFIDYRYDDSLTIVSEYDIHLRSYVDGCSTHYVPKIIARCALGGASSNLSRSLVETNEIRRRHLTGKWKNKLLSKLLSLYYAQKRVRFLLYGHRV